MSSQLRESEPAAHVHREQSLPRYLPQHQRSKQVRNGVAQMKMCLSVRVCVLRCWQMFCLKQTDTNGNFWKDGSLAVLAFATEPITIAQLKREPVLQQGHSGDAHWACWCCPGHSSRVV